MEPTIENLLAAARQAAQDERWQEAEQAFSTVLERDPRCAQALFQRGLSRIRRREWSDASDDLDAAELLGLRHEPELYRARAMANYFSNYSHEHRLEDAERLIALAPEDPDGWFYRGDALSDLGDYENAIASLTKAIELKPGNADAYFQRGNAWDRLGEIENAVADFKASTDLGSNDPNVYHRKGHYFQYKGDFEQSAREFRAAIALEPEVQRHYQCGGQVLEVLEAEGVLSGDEVEAHYQQLERLKQGSDYDMSEDRHHIFNRVQEHFSQVPLEKLELTERSFPARTLPDIQCAFDELQNHGFEVCEFFATQHRGTEPVQNFAELYSRDRSQPVKPSNPKYKEFDIGEAEPFRCLKDGVWMLRSGESNLLALLDTRSNCYMVRLELAAHRTPEGTAATERFFQAIEASIQRSRCYRGKILSMEVQESYSGTAPGLMVHRIQTVERGQVILPQKTLDLLDRNVIQFARRREQLKKLGVTTKKGLLFYGPPGVGKTHTIQYLATSLRDHTTLLVTGAEVGNLSEYMTLARLYQPSIVVVEDVDLIARRREEMQGPAQEAMLNKLLNEMDGIAADAAIVFVLTTNRATVLEEALASRPGRIDQAIEFPLPTPEGRERLVRLYSHGLPIAEDVVHLVVQRTDSVSASFIKELMRRCVQFALDRADNVDQIERSDVESALEEMLVTGGSLNMKILGAIGRNAPRELGFGQSG